MTSQNYLQLVHHKEIADSIQNNNINSSYENTSSIPSDNSAYVASSPSASNNKIVLPYLNKEETHQDLPALPEKMRILRPKDLKQAAEKDIIRMTINNRIDETSSEPRLNSELLINGALGHMNGHIMYSTNCMESRRSS